MTRCYPLPAAAVPAAGQRALLGPQGHSIALFNSDKLKVTTYPVEKDDDRLYIVIEDSVP